MPLIQPPSSLAFLYPNRLWKGAALNRKVSLTFDDGPVPGVTDWVLEELVKRKLNATFFMVVDNVRKHPSLAQEVLSAGSTATSMAVFLNKPIVFLTSNQQNQDNTFVEHIEEMSTTLCMPLVNIDDSKSKWPLFPYPVNTYKYNQYVLRCLSSSTLKEPNIVLIKKEII